MKFFIIISFLFPSFSLWATSRCEATYDSLGITEQKVDSKEEYYFCFGYHHAKDRGWQMDFFRRFAYGRNAEVLGYKQIKNDFMMRLLDLPTHATRLWNEFPREYQVLLEEYSKGVNEGFKQGAKAHEFEKLDYTPEAWEPVHSVAILLLQSFDQTKKTFFFDIKEQEKLERYPSAQELFDENKTPWLTTILKNDEYQKKESIDQKVVSAKPLKLWANFPELFGKNSGSNNWVIDGKMTESGYAILANDPHLDLKTPLFWYWIKLKTPERTVIGASLPGLPFIASGTNGLVAWGLTNSYLNSADSVKITDLKSEEVFSSRPVIWFKLGFLKLPFFFKKTECYKNLYPVLPLEVLDIRPIVLRWSGYDLKATEVTSMFDLHETKNVSEVDEVLSKVGVPSWNYVFADTAGDVGYRMVGKTYKNESDSFGVLEMNSNEFLNPLYLGPDERPHLLKPKRHFVATANNQHWPEDSKFKGGRAYSLSFRANRIESLITKTIKHSIDSMKAIQCDLFVTDASYFIPVIRKYIPDFLSNWDFIAHDSSKDLSLYRRLMDLMMEKWDVNESALYLLLKDLDSKKVSELDILYKKAIKEVANKDWKNFAFLTFEHLSGDNRFQYSPILPALGDEHTVGPGTTRWSEDKNHYVHFSGASMRMVIEMSNPVKIHLNLPGKNRNYQESQSKDPWLQWRDCQYSQVAF